jgi:hypothetical protein
MLVSNDWARNVCGVKCVRSRQPIGALTGAEEAFRNHIACLWTSRSVHFCAVVEALDAQVRDGRVSRSMAGALASELRPFVAQVGLDEGVCSFLWRVAMHECQCPPCQCLHRLLSWGTCPHVVFVHQSACSADVIEACTPLTFISRDATKTAALLLQEGCPPWHWYRWTVLTQTMTRVTVRDADSVYVASEQTARQWWRWHARYTRQMWVRVIMGDKPSRRDHNTCSLA